MNQTELQQHIEAGTLAQAASQLEEERAAAQEKNEPQNLALAANDLGIVYLLQNRTDEARSLLTEAQQLFIQANDAAGQGRATGNLAELEERAGNGDAASALYMQAADLLHEGKAFEDEYATRRRLSRYYLTHGGTMMSLRETVKALTVKPNASWWDRFLCFFYRLPLQLMGLDKP
ncbi:MAG: tetratricopeptide repeat protein [Chloroflexi bacterium]|nr:tetratricopeptide repeat protein [Chloroflexota bacterium]